MKTFNLVIIYFLIFTFKFGYPQSEPVQRIDVVDESTMIYSIDITNDENFIATGTRSVKIWNSNTGQELINFTEHGVRDIVSIDFSNNNNWIASGDRAFEAILWNKNTGEVVKRFKSYDQEPRGDGILVALTPDSKKLFTAASNGAMQLWDIATGDELNRYQNRGVIYSIQMHPNGKYVFVDLGFPFMMDLNSGEPLRLFEDISSPSISIDGNVIQGIKKNQNDTYSIEQYNTNTGELIKSFPLTTEISPNVIDMSPDSKNYLIGNTIRQNGASNVLNRVLYDAITPGSIRSYTARANAEKDSPESEDEIIKYFPNGRKFLTVNGKAVHIWDISDVVTRIRDAGIYDN